MWRLKSWRKQLKPIDLDKTPRQLIVDVHAEIEQWMIDRCKEIANINKRLVEVERKHQTEPFNHIGNDNDETI